MVTSSRSELGCFEQSKGRGTLRCIYYLLTKYQSGLLGHLDLGGSSLLEKSLLLTLVDGTSDVAELAVRAAALAQARRKEPLALTTQFLVNCLLLRGGGKRDPAGDASWETAVKNA